MAQLLGHEFQQSKTIQELIQQLVEETQKMGQMIQAPRAAQAEFSEYNKKLVDQIGEARGRPLYFPYVGTGIGRGPYVELEDGSVKIDLINGIGIHIMGHSHPRVQAAALRGALQDQLVQGNLQPNQEYMRLAQKLVELASRKSRLRHVWLTTSGSMANENALKMCRQKTKGARKIIAMQGAFAGRTTMMAEITDNPNFKVGLPEYNEILRLPFGPGCPAAEGVADCASHCQADEEGKKALELLKQHMQQNKGDICAFMFEPIQGEGGFTVGCRPYLQPLFEVCQEEGIPVWADEVQTFCRTGEFFAFEALGFAEYVDVCTVAKTLQSAATLYTAELNPQAGLIAGTFAGSSPTLAAGHEILEMLDTEGFMGEGGQVKGVHKEFVGMLKQLAETSCQGKINEVGGRGLMVAMTPFDGSREKMLELLKKLYDNGVICFGCGHGPFRLRFLLPAILKSDDIQRVGEILEKSINEMAESN